MDEAGAWTSIYLMAEDPISPRRDRPVLFWIVLAALCVLALAVRFPKLGERPMHTDEAVNAYITGQILAGEGYSYDPKDRHGPLLYLSAAPLMRVLGAKSLADLDEARFRTTVAILSGLGTLAFGLLRRPLGPGAALVAALLWAVDPISLYYGRYIIHETGFVIATVALMAAGWRTAVRESRTAAFLAGVAAALMLGFKETASISFAALALALWTVTGTRRLLKSWSFALIAAAGFVAVIVPLFTWGFTDSHGLPNLFRAFVRFAGRAGGEGHEKPWIYYIHLLCGRPGGLLLFLLAAVAAVNGWRRGGFERFLAAYTVCIAAIYLAIPYKTPWLALNIWMPAALLAGLAITRVKHKVVTGVALAVLVGLLARESRWYVFKRAADENNPYAYSHTLEDFARITPTLERAAAVHPRGRELVIAVIADDPWPLPWYLRRFPNVGYWHPGTDPGRADVYLLDAAIAEANAARVEGLRPEFFGWRTGVLLVMYEAAAVETPAASR